MNNYILFCGRSNLSLSKAIAKKLEQPLGKLLTTNFDDGEIWVKFCDNVRGNQVIIIQSTQPPAENILELLIAIDAAKRASAEKIIVAIPYYGYARQDRKDQPRVSITAKLIANLLTKAGANRIIAMDLHANQIQGFFDIPVDHIFASRVLLPFIRSKNIQQLTIASPDVNGGKMARAWAKRLGVKNVVMVDQDRVGHNVSKLLNVIGKKEQIKGHNILLVDDIIDTAGKMCRAALTLKKMGAINIYGCGVHPILSAKANESIDKSSIKEVIVTDSVPLKKRISKKITVVSVAPLLAEVIERAVNNMSISSLFDELEMKR